MKLSKEQELELENIELKIRLNKSMVQNLQFGNNELFNQRVNLVETWVAEIREKESKPEAEYECNLDLNTYELTFTKKEGEDAIRPD